MARVTNISRKSLYPHRAKIIPGHLFLNFTWSIRDSSTTGNYEFSDEYAKFLDTCQGAWSVHLNGWGNKWYIEFERKEDLVRYNITLAGLPKDNTIKITYLPT